MQSVVRTGVIDSSRFDSFSHDTLAVKKSLSSTATESLSSDNMQPSSPQRNSPNRLPHHSPRSYGSPQHHNSPNGRSPMSSPSDRGLIHTRTNFGKTRGYVPPMVPSSPGRMDAPPVVAVPPSPHRVSTNPFEDEDAPDDEAQQFRTVRSLRPKPASRASLHRRDNSATQDVAAPPSPARRPEAYISETDESSMNLSFEPNKSSPARRPHPEARHPSPEEEEPFDMSPTTRGSEALRHPSPIENVPASPIRPNRKTPLVVPESPIQRSAEEIKELRRRMRQHKTKKTDQFEMPSPDVPPPMTSTKTSDLTEDTDLADPMPSFDQEQIEKKAMMGSEMEYYEEEEGDTMPPPAESPRYEEFHQGREASVSPQKSKPKSILRGSKRTSPATDDDDDDDDSLFDFDGTNSALGKGTSIRKSSLKNGTTMTNSSNRKGRRPRRKSEEEGNDDDESLIQYGEHRQRSSSLQERTQEAWTFRSKRSFSMASSRKDAQQAGVQFGNTDTIHHFDDQETIATNGTSHSLNSLYTKSPESEAEDLIKDLLMIGSGEHSNPGRRKLKYQPTYKRELREGGDDRSIDDNTLETTDVSLNTLEYAKEHPEFSLAVPKTKAKKEESLETSERKSDTQSKPVSEPLDTKKNASGEDEEADPLSMVWGYVESGMKALGLASTPPPPAPKETKGKEKNAKEIGPKPMGEEREVVDLLKEPSVKEDVLVETEFSAGTADHYPADEKKQEGIGSFNEVMEYMFGDQSQKPKEEDEKDKTSHHSSAGSVAATSVSLEEDPRLEDLAMHTVRSKHQVFDMTFDEKATVDIVKDIKFSLVKTKLPLGILFHENDGGCWITKVFPDGNAARAGGVEVGDQLAAINGISAIQLRVDQICTLITEAPDPENIELTFLRYTGQLHPVATPDLDEVVQESFEVTDGDALMKPPIKKPHSKSLVARPLSKLRSTRDPSPKRPDKSLKARNNVHKTPKSPGKKVIGKWFGKGKKKSPAI